MPSYAVLHIDVDLQTTTVKGKNDGLRWRNKERSEIQCGVAKLDNQVRRDWANVQARVVRYLSATVDRALPMGFGSTAAAAAPGRPLWGAARNQLRRFIHQSADDEGEDGRQPIRCDQRGAKGRAVWRPRGDGGGAVRTTAADCTALKLLFSWK